LVGENRIYILLIVVRVAQVNISGKNGTCPVKNTKSLPGIVESKKNKKQYVYMLLSGIINQIG
jgi:hypothetical protein